MFDIDLKNVKKGRKFFLIFLVVGVVGFIILTSVIIYSCVSFGKYNGSTMSINANIVPESSSDGGILYRKSYDYEVDGKYYTCISSIASSNSSMPNNKKIYYDLANPMNCEADDLTTTISFMAIFYIIPVIFFIIGLIGIIKNNKNIKKIMKLNDTGKLVKGLKYRLEPSNYSVNGVTIMKPVIDYQLPNGDVVALSGDPRHDRKSGDADGLVDLLIDEENPENYFIDFEINRLSGNLSSDYYNEPTSNIENEINQTAEETNIIDDGNNYQTISYKDLQNK